MIEIKSIEINSDLAKQLNQLLVGEWSDLGGFEVDKHGTKIPNPIIAIENGNLISGLSFTSYKKPASSEIGIWVNALFVDPRMRKQGVATKLILESQQRVDNLHALTDVPTLYLNTGWKLVSTDDDGSVVEYSKIS